MMLKRFSLLLLLFFFGLLTLVAQTINITLPDQSNKSYKFALNKGEKTIDIKEGTLNFAGHVLIDIPAEYKSFKGMAFLQVEGAPKLNLILNGESFSVAPNDHGSLDFKGSKENAYFYGIIENKVAFKPDSSLYANKFLELMQFTNAVNNAIHKGAGLAELAKIKTYAFNSADYETLFTSGLWVYVIDGLTKLNRDQTSMAKDMIRVLESIKSQEVFEYLTENLITITLQYGWDDAFTDIVLYAKESGRIPYPQGDLYDAFQAVQVRKGIKAPNVEGLETSDHKTEKTLLVFHQSDCVNCAVEVEQLVNRYNEFKEKNIRIVSISSDHDKEAYEQEIKTFPWKDKLCDFQGFAGTNFSQFGILATPTFIMLNEEGIVLGKYAQTKDIKL